VEVKKNNSDLVIEKLGNEYAYRNGESRKDRNIKRKGTKGKINSSWTWITGVHLERI